MKEALVSIIIPAFNAQKYILQSIQSALNQTYANKEVIIVDDGSNDNTLDIIKSFSNEIQYVSQPNKGNSVARNAGFSLSRGEYIQFLDADDILLPQKIDCQMQHLRSHPGCNVTYCDFRYFDDRDPNLFYGHQYKPESGLIFRKLLQYNFIINSAPIYPRKLIEEVGGFRSHGDYMWGVEDWDLLLRISYRKYHFCYLPNVLIHYRLHDASLSHNILKMKRGGIDVLNALIPMIVSPRERNDLGLKKLILRRRYDLGLYLASIGNVREARKEILNSLLVIDKLNIEKVFFLFLTYLICEPLKRIKILEKWNARYLNLRYGKEPRKAQCRNDPV